MQVDADGSSVPVKRPLCVDLDGSLVKSDTLLDALCQLLRQRPLALLRAPLWLRGGRAGVKREAARLAPLDPSYLPYNSKLLDYLRIEHSSGRALYLATGADGELAARIAAHLNLFQGVLATDPTTNLTRERKLRRLQERFGEFDYVGNSRADLVLLEHARHAMIANPTLGLRMALNARNIAVQHAFLDRQPVSRAVLQALCVQQWWKNLLLFVPLLLTRRFTPHAISATVIAFFSFNFMASAGCLIEGLLNIESDRRDPAQRLRPFAAGDLAVTSGFALAAILFLVSCILLVLLPEVFALWLGLFVAAGILHTLCFKHTPILNVLLVAGLYTLRLPAAGAATGTVVPYWLAAFAAFLFLLLAMIGRFREH